MPLDNTPDELLNLYALWANSADDIDTILEELEMPAGDACASARTLGDEWSPVRFDNDIPF